MIRESFLFYTLPAVLWSAAALGFVLAEHWHFPWLLAALGWPWAWVWALDRAGIWAEIAEEWR